MNPFETAEAGSSGERPSKCEDCGIQFYKANLTKNRTAIIYLFYLFKCLTDLIIYKKLFNLSSHFLFTGIHHKELCGPAHS